MQMLLYLQQFMIRLQQQDHVLSVIRSDIIQAMLTDDFRPKNFNSNGRVLPKKQIE